MQLEWKKVEDKPARKKLIGMCKRRWEDNTRMDVKEIYFNTTPNRDI